MRKASKTDPRERILSSASEVFASTGFAGARIDEIAEHAGVNKAMLYYHVGDKEQLYTAVLTETVERGLASLNDAIENVDSPSEKLQAIIDTLAAFGTSNPYFIPIMLREIASGGSSLPDEMLLRMGAIFRLVADVLAKGVSEGAFRSTDPLLTHVSLIGTTMFLVATQPVRDRVARSAKVPVLQHSPADLARHIGNLFLHGLEINVRKPAPPKKKSTKRGTSPRRS